MSGQEYPGFSGSRLLTGEGLTMEHQPRVPPTRSERPPCLLHVARDPRAHFEAGTTQLSAPLGSIYPPGEMVLLTNPRLSHSHHVSA